ncbi:MAG: DMT family transporter [Oceanospirillaceae bacterium]
MFFLLAIISTFAYSLQSSLLVKQARSMDRLSLAFYRMLALSFILAPMLLGVEQADYQQLPGLIPLLLLSGICGGTYVWAQFYAVQFIPLGVATSLNQSVRTLAAFLLGYVLLAESLVSIQIVLITIILLGGAIVASSRNKMQHLHNDTRRGVITSLVAGLLGATSFFILSFATKQANPFMIGYFWEFSILLGTGVILILRRLSGKRGLHAVTVKEFKGIAFASSPTLLGTAGAALALQSGSLAVFMSIASLSVIFTAIFGRVLYKEKLRTLQWLGIFLSLLGVVGLKLYS